MYYIALGAEMLLELHSIKVVVIKATETEMKEY